MQAAWNKRIKRVSRVAPLLIRLACMQAVKPLVILHELLMALRGACASGADSLTWLQANHGDRALTRAFICASTKSLLRAINMHSIPTHCISTYILLVKECYLVGNSNKSNVGSKVMMVKWDPWFQQILLRGPMDPTLNLEWWDHWNNTIIIDHWQAPWVHEHLTRTRWPKPVTVRFQ